MILTAILGPCPDPYPDPQSKLGKWPPPGPMARPRVLLLNTQTAIVYGYAADGEFAGDSWYESNDLAKAAIAREYGIDLGPWEAAESNDLNEAIVVALKKAQSIGICSPHI